MKNLSLIVLILFSCNNTSSEDRQSKAVGNLDTIESKDILIVDTDTAENTVEPYYSKLDQDPLIFIQTFYKEYLLAVENRSADSILPKYCTSKLLNKIESSSLGFDPFIDAQDFDDNLLKTLKVREDTTQLDNYIVSYIDGYTGKEVFIILNLKKSENGYRIDDVINN